MKRRSAILFAAAVVAVVSVLGVAACGGGVQEQIDKGKQRAQEQVQEGKQKAGKKAQEAEQKVGKKGQ
jgi:hypothetical protein